MASTKMMLPVRIALPRGPTMLLCPFEFEHRDHGMMKSEAIGMSRTPNFWLFEAWMIKA
jgi:hypothetical protein